MTELKIHIRTHGRFKIALTMNAQVSYKKSKISYVVYPEIYGIRNCLTTFSGTYFGSLLPVLA